MLKTVLSRTLKKSCRGWFEKTLRRGWQMTRVGKRKMMDERRAAGKQTDESDERGGDETGESDEGTQRERRRRWETDWVMGRKREMMMMMMRERGGEERCWLMMFLLTASLWFHLSLLIDTQTHDHEDRQCQEWEKTKCQNNSVKLSHSTSYINHYLLNVLKVLTKTEERSGPRRISHLSFMEICSVVFLSSCWQTDRKQNYPAGEYSTYFNLISLNGLWSCSGKRYWRNALAGSHRGTVVQER